MGIGEGVQQRDGKVTVHQRQDPIGPPPVGGLELVEECLTDGIGLVVLVDAGPAHHRLPQDLVEPGVLEGGAHKAGRIPLKGLEGRVDEQHAQPETAMHERRGLGLVDAMDRGLGVGACRLADPLLGDDTDSLGLAGLAEVPEVGVADQRRLDDGANVGVSALDEHVRPEDRLVGQRSLRQRERPLPQPVVGA